MKRLEFMNTTEAPAVSRRDELAEHQAKIKAIEMNQDREGVWRAMTGDSVTVDTDPRALHNALSGIMRRGRM